MQGPDGNELQCRLSVTCGGTLFHQPGLAVPVGDPVPFENYMITAALSPPPTLILPVTPLYREVMATLDSFAGDTWVRLSEDLPPPAPAAAGGGLNAEQFQQVIDPIVDKLSKPVVSAKETEQSEQAADIAAHYRLALASLPADNAPDQDHMVIPDLTESFMKVLTKTKPLAATVSLQELFLAAMDRASRSTNYLDTNVTFEAEVCNVALANILRSFHVLLDPMAHSPISVIKAKLGLIHFLSPDRARVVKASFDDPSNGPVSLSHISDDKAQLEASRSSTLYCGGRLERGQDLLEVACNFRLFLLIVSAAAEGSLLWVKLLAYLSLLQSRQGKQFMATYRDDMRLVLGMFGDMQHIVTVFLQLAKKPALRTALAANQPVSTSNYLAAAQVADHLITRLRTAIGGNGIGPFVDMPSYAPLFIKEHKPTRTGGNTPSTPAAGKGRERSPPAAVTPGASDSNKASKDETAAALERKKQGGFLIYQPPAGSRGLPSCPVMDKVGDSPTAERLCMQFATKDHYCSRRPTCPYPHITSWSRLSSAAKQKQMSDWVAATPGMSFVPSKGPPGM